MAGIVLFREKGRERLAKTLAVVHWICIIPSFVCLLAALYIQISIEDKIFFIEDYNGAILPGALVFSGFFGLFTHILSGKVTFSNRRIDKRKKWAMFLLPVVIVTFVIFLAEMVSGIMCFIHVADLGESFHAGIKQAMAAYKNDASTKEQMDVLQMTYDCCGSKGYRDWFYLPWIHADYITEAKMRGRHSDMGETFVYDDVPFSCCNPAVLRPCIHQHVLDNKLHYKYDHRTKTTLHNTGCSDRLMDFYENSVLMLIGTIVLSMSFIQLFLTVGCRYLQTAIQGAMASDDPEGPSHGYLFKCGKPKKDMDETATTEETEHLLDTTADSQDTAEFSFDDEERYVEMFSEHDGNDAHYENVPPFETEYDEAYADGSLPPPEDSGEHIYHDHEVEDYLARRYAASREKFEIVSITPPPPEDEDIEPGDIEEPAYANINHSGSMAIPGSRVHTLSSAPSGTCIPGSGLSLTGLKPHVTGRTSHTALQHDSYMPMNMSNSSVKKRNQTGSRQYVHLHHLPSPVSQDGQPYVINMKSQKSPSSPMSPPRLPRNISPIRRRLNRVILPFMGKEKIGKSPKRTHIRLSRPMISPIKPTRGFGNACTRGLLHSPVRRKRRAQASTFVPYIYNTFNKAKRRDSPNKSRSPVRRISPCKMEIRSGVSYECNHQME